MIRSSSPERAAARPSGEYGIVTDMTEREIELKLAELDRLLNDPDTRMDPHKVWSLLAELSEKPPSAPHSLPKPGKAGGAAL
jgi:hypothetical protein